jgi:cytochrome c oxidase cbb3-type subunit I
MTTVQNPDSSASASSEITAVETLGRGPLLLLIGSGILWLVLSSVLALISAIQLHSPAFLSHASWLTFGRVQAMAESTFIYGWCGNAGLAIALWVLARLGGSPLRALNWVIVGALFWNVGVTLGVIGIGAGEMTSFSWLQMPRGVQILLVFAYAAVAISGVLAWSGRRNDMMYASHWYAVAALFAFPWISSAAQVMLLWAPVRGVLQAISAGWFMQAAWSMWLAPLALAAAYYIVPKVTGRSLPSYQLFAPLAFWVLIFVGAWTGGRNLIGGPVPAWIATLAVISCVVLLFHYAIVLLNLRIAFGAGGTALKFIRFGLGAYVLVGVLNAITSFRGVAVETQFTLLDTAFQQLALYGAVTMIFFGAIYYMVPRLIGRPWASVGLTVGHRILVKVGVVLMLVTLGVAGWTQGADLLNEKITLAGVFEDMRLSLLMSTGAQLVLLAANLLLLVNFFQSLSALRPQATSAGNPFRAPSTLEAPVA